MSRMWMCSLHGAVIRRGGKSPGVSLASSESLADLCREFQHVVNSVFEGEKRLIAVIQFPFRGSVLRIDLSDTKTTSLLCAVGLGFGIGTYILYRLYCRYIQPFLKRPPDGKLEPCTANKSTETNHDEGGSVMGNTGSTDESPPIRYNARDDVVEGLPDRTPNIPMSPSKPRQRRRKQRKAANSEKTRPRRTRTHDSVSISSDEGDNPLNVSHDASDGECGSLKGNLSIRSLSERNVKYGYGHEKSVDTSSGQERTAGNLTKVTVKEEGQEYVSDSNMATGQGGQTDVGDSARLGVVNRSLVLTPPSPSEEEGMAYAQISTPRALSHDTTPTSGIENDRSGIENYVSFGPLSSSPATTGAMTSSGVMSMSISDQEEEKDPSFTDYTTNVDQNTVTSINNNENNTLQTTRNTAGTLDNFTDSPLIDIMDNRTGDQPSVQSSGEDTEALSSPYKSAGSYIYGGRQSSSSGNMSVEEEGTTNSLSSPLHGDRKTGFQQTLLHRLQDCSTGGSNSTSLETSPDVSPYHHSVNSGISSRQESFSDLGTSDSEIFNMEGTGSFAEQEFSKIEGEISHLDEEFISLNTKLSQLMSKSLSNGGDSAALPKLCVNTGSKSLPASPVHKANDALLSNKRLKHCISGNSSRSHSDSSFSPQHAPSDLVDLSWEYYDMDPGNLPRDSQLKQNSEDEEKKDKGKFVVKEENSDIMTFSSSEDVENGHTTCDDLETDSCMDGAVEDNSPKWDQSAKSVVQVGPITDIMEYAEREWRGDTDKASTIKQAYREVPRLIACENLQQMRGDNYCAVRGCLFQCLSHALSPVSVWGSQGNAISLLRTAFSDPASGLQLWNFGGRMSTEDDLLQQMEACINCLFSKFEEVERLPSYKERQLWTTSLLNSDPSCDVMLMEGVKLLMYLEAARLYTVSQAGSDVPVFVWLMYARDTSDTPAKFVTNHLNCVGGTAGLEQVEMFLLGHTLGVSVRVIRLGQYGQDDFVSYFPDDKIDQWPTISLLAEDDRHYNVPVS